MDQIKTSSISEWLNDNFIMADGHSDSHVNKVQRDMTGNLNASKFGDRNVININYGAPPGEQKYDELAARL